MIIAIKDNFNIEQTAYSGQCFRAKALPGLFMRFVTKNSLVCIREITLDGEDPKADIVYFEDSQGPFHYFEATSSLEEWREVWEDYFDLGLKYEDIRKFIPKNDTYAIKSYEYSRGIRILRQDGFEMLISYIISQRKSIPAITSAVEKISMRYGMLIGKDIAGEDVYAFPTPEQLSRATEEELSECGLGYRVDYVLDAVSRVVGGELDLEKISDFSDEELFEELKKVSGVGDKVSNCVSLFGYHRVGRAPVDTWIAKVINEEYGGINPFDRYGEVAGIVQQYIFFHARSTSK